MKKKERNEMKGRNDGVMGWGKGKRERGKGKRRQLRTRKKRQGKVGWFFAIRSVNERVRDREACSGHTSILKMSVTPIIHLFMVYS